MVNYPFLGDTMTQQIVPDNNIDCPPQVTSLDFDIFLSLDDIQNFENELKIEMETPNEFTIPDGISVPEGVKMPDDLTRANLPLPPIVMEVETCEFEPKGQEDYTEIPVINYPTIRASIENYLQGFETTAYEIQKLSDIEQAILSSIKEKKILVNEEAGGKGKRVEEKQKCVFKAALKYSENKYFSNIIKNSKKKIKKRDLEQIDFYESYFGESSKKNNCSLSNFFNPNRKLKCTSKKSVSKLEDTQAGLKSFNSTYIDLILSSEEFRNDTVEFLENFFVQDYMKTRHQKIDKVLKYMNKIIEGAWAEYQFTYASAGGTQSKMTAKEFILKRIRDTIIFNPKSKLPWSNGELEEAKIFAYQKIQKAKDLLDAYL